jgi:hypothetical protein
MSPEEEIAELQLRFFRAKRAAQQAPGDLDAQAEWRAAKDAVRYYRAACRTAAAYARPTPDTADTKKRS